MRKVLNFVNDNKKIIIVVILIIILVGTIYFINKVAEKDKPTSSGTAKSATELKLSGILSAIEGVGDTDVMITEDDDSTERREVVRCSYSTIGITESDCVCGKQYVEYRGQRK